MKPTLYLRKALRWWPVALVILASTIWAWSAALLQATIADQLVNGFLFENTQTFQGAIFPLEHLQLLKWPLFMVLGLGHFAPALYVGLTIAVAVVTVIGLTYVLYRISGRRMVFGLLSVLLASIVLLVPVQVFDGGVSAPLSMAMLTGRNIEYLIFLGVLTLYLKARGFRNWQWTVSTLLLSLLLASDTLFAYYSFGGALLFGVAALLLKNSGLKRTARYWLIGSVVAWLLSVIWQQIIGHTLTHVVSYPLGYEQVTSLMGAWQGLTGTIQALALNFGLTMRAGYASAPAFVLNLITIGLIIYAVYWLVRRLYTTRDQNNELPLAISFATMLLATTLVTIAGFALTNQPYMQNARYLTISLFSGFVLLAVWLRNTSFKLPQRHVLPLTVVAICIVTLAAVATIGHTNNLLANNALSQRNQKIAAALQQHHVEFLVGNYWRVIPIRSLTPSTNQAIVPLQSCAQRTATLTSATWRPDLLTHSFAYLLTSQSLSVPQPACTKRLLIHYYGQPASEVVIAGSAAKPTEQLLFYDDGAAAKLPR